MCLLRKWFGLKHHMSTDGVLVFLKERHITDVCYKLVQKFNIYDEVAD